MATQTASPTKVTTGRVRLSYVHLFEPWSSNPLTNPARYSVMVLIPKTDTATLGAIRKAEAAAAELGKAKFGGTIPRNLKSVLHDGDEEADLDKNPERAGHFYMTTSSKTKPGVVDAQVKPILDSTEVYSGCWARVAINGFAYSNNGNKGISFGLNHVQKVADDEVLGGGSSRAEDEFEPIEAGVDESVL